MKLIVGLGNPEKKYLDTFHNMGFLCVDKIADELNIQFDNNKFHSVFAKTKVDKETVLVVKPLTYMNNSGLAVREIMDYYDIAISDLLVIYDDLDLPCGKIRLREKGNAGGHNGIKSINQHLGSIDYKRIRIGIDRHEYMSTVDYVLSKPSNDQIKLLKMALDDSAAAAIEFIKTDFNKVMNKYNVSK